jgi:DNA-directed RNA polymerase subunit E'/Rpb7
MNNFVEIKNHDVVKLSPKFLDAEYITHITNTLKRKYEGVCSKFGYIKNDSIKVLDVKQGVVERSTFHGYVVFEVEFSAMICNPGIKSVVRCTVKNINSFGILGVSGIQEKSGFKAILNIIVPKHNNQQSSTLSDNSALLDRISINDEIFVEILGKKYILNNKNINVFGRVVDREVFSEADETNTGIDTGLGAVRTSEEEDDEQDADDIDSIDPDNSDVEDDEINESVANSDILDEDDINGGDLSEVGSVDGDNANETFD